jgi:hypothetical protein
MPRNVCPAGRTRGRRRQVRPPPTNARVKPTMIAAFAPAPSSRQELITKISEAITTKKAPRKRVRLIHRPVTAPERGWAAGAGCPSPASRCATSGGFAPPARSPQRRAAWRAWLCGSA